MSDQTSTAITCCKCEGGCERESHGEPLCDQCERDGCRPCDEAVTEPRHRAFTEASLHRDIVDTWGEHGAHNDVFTFMRLEISALRAVVFRAHSDMWKDDEGRDVMACRGLLTLPVQHADAVRRAVAGKGIGGGTSAISNGRTGGGSDG